MCALLLQSRKFWWYILLISLMLFYDVIMTLYCCQRASDNDFVFLQDSALAHRAAHEQQLNCCVKKQQTFLRPNCGLQTTQISVLWITRSGLSCSIVSTTDKSIVWMNWNGGSSISGAVLNSRFDEATDQWRGRHYIECVSMLKEDISSTACVLTMLICPYLLHSVWLVWLLHL